MRVQGACVATDVTAAKLRDHRTTDAIEAAADRDGVQQRLRRGADNRALAGAGAGACDSAGHRTPKR